jgi:PAS domain S-box-containing protein
MGTPLGVRQRSEPTIDSERTLTFDAGGGVSVGRDLAPFLSDPAWRELLAEQARAGEAPNAGELRARPGVALVRQPGKPVRYAPDAETTRLLPLVPLAQEREHPAAFLDGRGRVIWAGPRWRPLPAPVHSALARGVAEAGSSVRVEEDLPGDSDSRVVARRLLGGLWLAERRRRPQSGSGAASGLAWFRRFFEASPIAVGLARLDGEVVAANARFCELHRCSEARLLGQRVWDLCHPEDIDVEVDLETALGQRGQVYEREKRVLRADGSVAWVRLAISIVEDPTSGEPFVLGMMVDLSALRERESALRRARAEKETILAGMKDVVVEYIAPDHSLLWASEDIEALVPASDVRLGEVCHRTLFGREEPCEGCLMPEAMREGRVREREMRTPDGRDWHVRTVPVRDEQGAVSGVVQFGFDVSRIRAMERQLETERERLALALEGGALGTWDWHVPSGHVVFDQGWADMLGYRLDEIEPHVSAWETLVHPDDLDGVTTLLQDHLEGKTETYVTRHRMRHRDGRWVWILDRGRVLERDEAGDAIRMCGTHADVSETVEAEEQRLQQAERMQQAQRLESLGLLVGGIAHDFNNILMAVIGNLNLALGGVALPGEVRTHLREAEAAARRAADLTRQMLAYAGRGLARRERLDLAASVREMQGLLRSVVPRRIALELDAPLDRGTPLEADPSQLQQIVLNLVTNAAESYPEGLSGTVELAVTVEELDAAQVAELERGAVVVSEEPLRPGAHARLVVRDRGAGMTPEVARRIFEPFYSTKFAGRGLGLAAVSGIVRSHRGALLLETAPGEGTRFEVLLPLAETATPARAAPQPDPVAPEVALPGSEPAASGARGTLLVVDDEPSVRRLVAAMLERLGFAVRSAEDGRDALDLLEREAPAIRGVLLDLSMPRLGGVETWHELHARYPQLEVVFSSGYAESADEQRLRARGMRFLQKPYRLAELREVMDELFPLEAV